YWTRAVQYYGEKHRLRQMNLELLWPLLDITTTLDPDLIVAYRFGSTFLSDARRGGRAIRTTRWNCCGAGCKPIRITGASTRTWATCITSTRRTTPAQRRPSPRGPRTHKRRSG